MRIINWKIQTLKAIIMLKFMSEIGGFIDKNLIEFVKLGNLPEGRFFLPNYTPRVYVNKGSVRAIEFFQKQQTGQDLESHGEIHIEMLPFSRIQQKQDTSLLHEAFHIPPEESLEQFLAKQNSDAPSE